MPMPEASDGSESSVTSVSNQLATLVPSFDPAKDDLQVYQQKVALLLEAWPAGKYTELATRLILNCAGSAFKKLQLHQAELIANERKSIQRIIELLGGHWGQIDLEKKYEFAERALYKCLQKSDESADSYLARADIMWTELNSKQFKLSDLQAYVTLRGSVLSAEDKKRVLVDADVSDKGELTVPRVSGAIRMLGAGFFQEMTSGKRVSKLKTYDQTALVAEEVDETEPDQYAMTTDAMDDEDNVVETLAQEGDDDASLVMDFESAAAEVLQTDEELAAAFTAYTDARRRLNEKVRSRGFWPVSQKGKSRFSGKGVKGKFSKGHASSRKSLQQRILESRCRLCNQVGHWKAECPSRRDPSGASSKPSQAPTTFAQVISPSNVPDDGAMPLEFLNLPMHEEPTLDVPQHNPEVIMMVQHVEISSRCSPNPKNALQKSLQRWKRATCDTIRPARNDEDVRDARHRLRLRMTGGPASSIATEAEPEPTCFASHGSLGIVDLGATKTVIGSKLVPELLNSLDPNIRKHVKRCPCAITFRFGNHGVLQSHQAIVVPIPGLLLKIAVVPGSTPFLLSNTLLRALGATIDTTKHVLHATKIGQSFQLNLTSKGLFLLDLNDLAQPISMPTEFSKSAETHATVCGSEDQQVPESKTPRDSIMPVPSTHATPINHDMSHEHESNNLQSIDEDAPPSSLSTSMSSQKNSKMVAKHVQWEDDHSPFRSKSVPKSFQVTSRHGHVNPVSASSTCAGTSVGSRIRFQTSVDGTTGQLQDQVWEDTRRKDLQPDVAPGTEVDPMVCPTLQQEPQMGPPSVSLLRGQEGGALRTVRVEDPSHQQLGDHGCHKPEAGEHCPDLWRSAEGQDDASPQSRDASRRVGSRRRGSGFVWNNRAGAGISSRTSDAISHGIPSGIANAAGGECPEQDCQLHRAEHHHADQRAVRSESCPSLNSVLLAGDLSEECNFQDTDQLSPESNRERTHFQQLIQKYTKQLQTISQQHELRSNKAPRLDLLEVFCGPQSQLTAQSQKLGYRAERFSMLQGDLQTTSGREELFKKMVLQRPRNIWFSPTCGPWSGFSCLNGSRSVDAWDDLQHERMKHLEQVALGVVILRYQRQQSSHMHWEQPRNSLMFKVPYMQEVRFYMLAIDVDLCIAGNLKDPQNGLPIKKSLTIMTTSKYMVKSLTGLRCHGNDQHQVIEGQVNVGGQKMNRSSFTANYPRKFARKLALILGRVHKPLEEPYRNEIWPALAAAEHPESPQPKRQRLQRYASAKLSRTQEISSLPWGKRLKCSVKTTPVDAKAMWTSIMDKVHTMIPRVGKRCLEDPELLNMIQPLIPDKTVVTVVACRGASRTLAPPAHILKGMAPYRRCVFTERGSGEIRAEEEWESWELLAKRNLIRPSHATRINLTLFAKESSAPASQTERANSSCMPSSTPAMNPSQMPGNSDESELPGESEAPLPSSNPSTTNCQGPPELTSSQTADLHNPRQSARFQALPKDEQVALLRAHKNLGHPSGERLSTLLRSQGFRAELAQAALELKCSACQEQQQPKLARPGSIRDELDFNDRICMDEFDWTNKDGTVFRVFHVVDWATNFQCARIAPDRSSSAIIQILTDMWFAWAGSPSEVIVDAGSEFNSEEFAVFAQANNIRLSTISPEAQYQNGKAERHGAVLKTMLTKFEVEHPITQYHDLSQALFWCIRAKNACSLKKGFAPEVLVLGKQTRLPGAVCSDEMLPAHFLADAETAQGIAFRRQLASREAARLAFFQADNDASLRRAMLRRSRPGGQSYSPGEWVMTWKQGRGAQPGHWLGPMKVVIHENAQTIWTTLACKLYRCAPEHVRPVTANEAREIPIHSKEPSVSSIAQQLTQVQSQGITQAINLPEEIPIDQLPPHDPTIAPIQPPSDGQPDDEPEIPSRHNTPSHQSNSSPDNHNPEIPLNNPNTENSNPIMDPAITTPVPDDDADDLACDQLLCIDDDQCLWSEGDSLAWKCEIPVFEKDIQAWKEETNATDMAFLVSAAKRQRSEVKLSTLNDSEKLEFQKAKRAEVQNWIKTGTISKILREQVPPEQILRCRWVLTWKPIDDPSNHGKSTKAKARLVILGYLDPKLEELPRDSPTLGRNSKMLLLQLIASKGWQLRSFDIRAAFLQGKPQSDRTLAIEPVSELVEALQLAANEVCKLEKGAYGLIDAPYQWFLAISEALKDLGFTQSPFDPCKFLLYHHETGNLEGILGLHVDDGICGGSNYFAKKLDVLEQKYPFGSKKLKQFTFTGIEMDQLPNGTITMKQSTYVRAIEPIKISLERRKLPEEKVTESERQALRGLVGSLQYAAVHTRPDLSSRLSMLQSSINSATVTTLINANQALHEAKKHHDTTIQIQPIPLEDFRFLAFSDASFASKSNPSSHTGSLIMGTHKLISDNVACPVSPLSWGCKKIQRVVTSTLAAETVSLNSVLDHLSWMRLCWAWMLDPTVNWKQPNTTLKVLPSTYATATYQAQNLPESVAATDCKSLYDLITRTATPNCAEYRTQLNARAIKDLISEGVELRWVHSAAQLADCLTKVMETSFLRETLKIGRYRLNDELEILKNRASSRNRLRWLKTSESRECNDECFLNIGFLGV